MNGSIQNGYSCFQELSVSVFFDDETFGEFPNGPGISASVTGVAVKTV